VWANRIGPQRTTSRRRSDVAQSVKELTQRMEETDLWSYSTNEDQCDNCKFYKTMSDERKIGYCAHRDVDMVVGAIWWCKLWEPTAAEAKQRAALG
jgi:hypothetical protein